MIEHRDAAIRTVQVEIKALLVESKQMTLAIFRQLQLEQVIGEDGCLNGDPWGIVNYYPGPCAKKDLSHHLHVIWLREGLLRRSCVEKNPRADPQWGKAIKRIEDEICYLNQIWGDWEEAKLRGQGIGRELSALANHMGIALDAGCSQNCELQIKHRKNALEESLRRWASGWESLSKLDQLFIAI